MTAQNKPIELRKPVEKKPDTAVKPIDQKPPEDEDGGELGSNIATIRKALD